MNQRNIRLRELAKEYLKEINEPICFASVGGSVARGEADSLSDIDLTIYVNHQTDQAENVRFAGEYIQLDQRTINEFPMEKQIATDPWTYRFLTEAYIIQDQGGTFSKRKDWVDTFYTSRQCKEKMVKQVTEVVEDRIDFAFNCLNEEKEYSATNAAMGAWAEAAFLFQFLSSGSLSTGRLMPTIQKIDQHFHRFVNVAPFPSEIDVTEISTIINRFRQELKQKGASFDFGLSSIQDELAERKSKRLIAAGEQLNLIWQTYGEALWLYFETSDGLSLEDYFSTLTLESQLGLARIGFSPSNEQEIQELGRLSVELLETAKHLAKESN